MIMDDLFVEDAEGIPRAVGGLGIILGKEDLYNPPNKKNIYNDSFYYDLDAGEYDDDPDILREEDPEVYRELYPDRNSEFFDEDYYDV